VFVADGAGRFTPREVRVGRRTAGQVELLSGVTDGDQVAASATFFLDSESQLRGALQKYEPQQGAPADTAAAEFDVTFRTEPTLRTLARTRLSSASRQQPPADLGCRREGRAVHAANADDEHAGCTIRGHTGRRRWRSVSRYRGGDDSGAVDRHRERRRAGTTLGARQFAVVAK
jgi:hypothetical protein